MKGIKFLVLGMISLFIMSISASPPSLRSTIDKKQTIEQVNVANVDYTVDYSCNFMQNFTDFKLVEFAIIDATLEAERTYFNVEKRFVFNNYYVRWQRKILYKLPQVKNSFNDNRHCLLKLDKLLC